MISRLLDYYFWFSQPPTILTNADKSLGYLFLASLISSIILGFAKRLIKHETKKKLASKIFYLLFTLGLSGLIWYGIRYENTPILANRYWAGLVLILGLIWVLFIIKYLIFNFPKELKEYNHEVLKNKYLPSSKN